MKLKTMSVSVKYPTESIEAIHSDHIQFYNSPGEVLLDFFEVQPQLVLHTENPEAVPADFRLRVALPKLTAFGLVQKLSELLEEERRHAMAQRNASLEDDEQPDTAEETHGN